MDLLLSLIPGGSTLWLLAAGASGVLALIWWARRSGRQAERARQLKRDLKAKDEQLEMHREASAEERRTAGMTDEEAMNEALRWRR